MTLIKGRVVLNADGALTSSYLESLKAQLLAAQEYISNLDSRLAIAVASGDTERADFIRGIIATNVPKKNAEIAIINSNISAEELRLAQSMQMRSSTDPTLAQSRADALLSIEKLKSTRILYLLSAIAAFILFASIFVYFKFIKK